MMKMEIRLDEERIKRDGEYDLAELWARIDKEFENGCRKDVQADGSVMYVGIPDKDYYTDFSAGYMILSELQPFAKYCVKWIWYDNDDDESQPFSDEDVLQKEKMRNPLFVHG